MTRMRTVSIPIPEDLDSEILKLKKTDRFIRSSYSEIARILICEGLKSHGFNVSDDMSKDVNAG